MEQRLSVVTLGVADLARAESFYEAMGWKRGNQHGEVAFYQAGSIVVALFARTMQAADAGLPPAAGKPNGFGGMILSYNTRGRDEVDTVLAQAAAAGGTIMNAARDAAWGGYSGYFADPDGHIWEVAWNPEWHVGMDGSITLPY